MGSPVTIRSIAEYVSERTNHVAIIARNISQASYTTLCNQLAQELDTHLNVIGSRVFMLAPDTGTNNGSLWPVIYRSDGTTTTEEDASTRIELFSQIQSYRDWFCEEQVRGQAFRVSSTTELLTIYATASILDSNGFATLVLKSAVPVPQQD